VGLGLFEDLHDASDGASFSDELKASARRYYGTALREFLKRLVPQRQSLSREFSKFEIEFKKKVLPQTHSGELARAASRFALIAFAGKKATEWGITGWKSEEAEGAAVTCFESWLEARGTGDSVDDQKAISRVRLFLEEHGASRFQHIHELETEEVQGIRDRAGFRRSSQSGNEEFLFFPEVFKEICRGYNYQSVAKALHKAGFLRCQEPALTIKTSVPGVRSARFFCVGDSIFDDS
jgi:putative DNA primase/helicase